MSRSSYREGVIDFPFMVFSAFSDDVEARKDLGITDSEDGCYLPGKVLQMRESTPSVRSLIVSRIRCRTPFHNPVEKN